MGITGTEVSKDAASMILADDNFATIVKAVVNGRGVYTNIKNAINFLLSGNMAGILHGPSSPSWAGAALFSPPLPFYSISFPTPPPPPPRGGARAEGPVGPAAPGPQRAHSHPGIDAQDPGPTAR